MVEILGENLVAHIPTTPFSAFSGPRDARVLLVGEAWGETEQMLRKPFSGESGKELFLMLGEAMPQVSPELHSEATSQFRYGHAWVKPREAWLQAAGIAMTNVFNLRPAANKIETLCGSKAEVGGQEYKLPHLSQGKYVRPEFLPEVDRLFKEIWEVKPNLIVLLGNTACWAVLQQTNIGSIRGTITKSGAFCAERDNWIKAIGTYHPAGMMRQWSWRTIIITDLIKAGREGQFPEIRRPARQVTISPTLVECEAWVRDVLANPPPLLSVDIETEGGQIKCVGFGRSRTEAFIIPFLDKAKPTYSHWPTAGEERRAWDLCEALLSSPIPKLFQNGVYDLQYLLRAGLRIAACHHDTMLLHHSWFPEMLKGLGFLGSVYTDEPAWKLMRLAKADTTKADE